MKQHRSGRARRAIKRVWRWLALVGALPVVSVAAFGRSSHRRSRRLGASAHAQRGSDAPPVSDEQRCQEPLGTGIAWGQLDLFDGRYQNVPYLLSRQFILIGRQNDCDIILDDDRASRYHALLAWDHGRGYAHDNGSTNGTKINGQAALGPMPLRHGDIIELAGSQFRFSYSPESGLAQAEAQPTEKIALPGMPARDAPANHVRRARITALTGSEPGRAWPIVNGAMTIGRGNDNLIVLHHSSVSRRHAQILVQEAGIYAQDIGSVNGTSVNGEPLTAPRLLHHGDHMQVGDVLLVVAIEDVAATNLEELPTQRLPVTGGLPEAPAPVTHSDADDPATIAAESTRPLPAAPTVPHSQFKRPVTRPVSAPGTNSASRLPRFRPSSRPDRTPPRESNS